MIANLYTDESTASRCLDLIARHAPRMMKVGGGALAADYGMRGEKRGPRMTAEQRARVRELGREGKLSATQIARLIGSTQSAVRSHLVSHGITPPIGRRGDA